MIFFKKNYHQLNTIEISKSALLHNYSYLSSLSKNISVAPVLKSNAYGHGLTLVAKILDTVNAPFFCVDSLYEAYELLKAGVKTHILIMGYTDPENLKIKKLPFSLAVYDKETLEALHKYQPQAGIHIFVDTGMNREGIRMEDLPKFLEYCQTFKNLKIEGLMSHFGASDKYNDQLTQQQVKNFLTAQKMLHKFGFNPKWIHNGNSAVSLQPDNYKDKIGNIIRVGTASYGLGDEMTDKNLRLALRVLTILSQIKSLRKGEKIGYDFTYTAKKDMTIGILPYGYYDGLDRRLSNKGFVLINNNNCPIIGKVSMNITTVDITNVKNPSIGQSVTVYSHKQSDKNSFYNASILTKTIQRDLLVHLASSTKRIVVQ